MRVSTNQYNQTSLNTMLDQQAKLSKIQQQVGTGRRILTPSDDPAGSARTLQLAKSIDTIQKYNDNADFADSRMAVEEGVLSQAGDILTRVRELAIQANNATTTPDDRRNIAAEVRQRLDELVNLANSTDGNGEYLFAGNQTRTRPFVTENGQVNYKGDQAARAVQVGPGRQLTTTHSGYEVFMKVASGSNGFAVKPAGNGGGPNQGSGTVAGVEIADTGATQSPPYTIAFSDASGTLQYSVNGGTAKDYKAGEPITFDGLSVTVDGTPASGDTFSVDKASPQSIFATIDRFAGALESSASGATANAAYLNVGNETLQNLDNATENLLNVRAEIGGRMNALDNERNANGAAVLELQKTKSQIEDLDYAKAVTELNQRLTGLKAAQQSYTKIQGLSLFDYLR